MLCSACKKNINKDLRTRQDGVNRELSRLGRVYYDSLGLALGIIDATLREYSFESTSECLTHDVTGQAKLHQEIGDGKYIYATFYRMESGRYEMIAYVS